MTNTSFLDVFDSPLLGMTTQQEQQLLFDYTSRLYQGKGAIVDLGCWLGSTTLPLAAGLRERGVKETKVIAFDRFIWEQWMEAVPGLGEHHLSFRPGDSFRAEYEERLGSFWHFVETVEGDLAEYEWGGQLIEFLLVDAMKSIALCQRIACSFLPHLIPQCGVLAHQDFLYWGCPWIHMQMYRLRSFFDMESISVEPPTVCFPLSKRMDDTVLVSASQNLFEDADEIREAFQYWSWYFEGMNLHNLVGAQILALGLGGHPEHARSAFMHALLDGDPAPIGFDDEMIRLGVLESGALKALLAPEIEYMKSGKSEPVAVWGASNGGAAFAEKYPEIFQNTLFFIDSDPQKWDSPFLERPVISPPKLSTKQKPPFIFVASSASREIANQLDTMGFLAGKDFAVSSVIRELSK